MTGQTLPHRHFNLFQAGKSRWASLAQLVEQQLLETQQMMTSGPVLSISDGYGMVWHPLSPLFSGFPVVCAVVVRVNLHQPPATLSSAMQALRGKNHQWLRVIGECLNIDWIVTILYTCIHIYIYIYIHICNYMFIIIGAWIFNFSAAWSPGYNFAIFCSSSDQTRCAFLFEY